MLLLIQILHIFKVFNNNTIGMQLKKTQAQPKKKQDTSKKLAFITDSKKNYQYVFKAVFLMATIFSAVLLKKVYQFQVLPEFDEVRMGTVKDFLQYSLPFAVIFTIIDLLAHYFLDGPCEKYFLSTLKYQGKARQKRAYTLVKWSYSIIYYTISSMVAYVLIKDTTFFPTWLGGKGACINIVNHAPALPEATENIKIFYLLQFGKHFSRLFSHLFLKQQGNFYQYTLHHALSTFLIFFSYLTNQWLIGVMVLLCHDISDLFLIIGRGYRDYKYYSKKVINVINVFVFISWVGGRLIVYPACCVYSSLIGPGLVIEKLTPFQQQVLILPYRWMGYMLTFLLFLQIFWTYYIARGVIQASVSQKLASNNYD